MAEEALLYGRMRFLQRKALYFYSDNVDAGNQYPADVDRAIVFSPLISAYRVRVPIRHRGALHNGMATESGRVRLLDDRRTGEKLNG
jgi:hypothetical protein